VVADLSQLHQNIHNAEKVRVRQSRTSLVHVDVLIVKQTLPPAQVALYYVLDLFWELFFNILFHAPEKERSQD